MKTKLKTKYGVAVKNRQGYYRIVTHKEGNHNKSLHRCVIEDYYGNIPSNHNIHHINGDKGDNRIENLVVLPIEQHKMLHNII